MSLVKIHSIESVEVYLYSSVLAATDSFSHHLLIESYLFALFSKRATRNFVHGESSPVAIPAMLTFPYVLPGRKSSSYSPRATSRLLRYLIYVHIS